MYTQSVYTQYEMLPEVYKQEASDFIEFLLSKANQSKTEKKPRKRNAYGSLKGKIKMADDFDAPLEEFKEYM